MHVNLPAQTCQIESDIIIAHDAEIHSNQLDIVVLGRETHQHSLDRVAEQLLGRIAIQFKTTAVYKLRIRWINHGRSPLGVNIPHD